MVIVDTSVWIDALRGVENPKTIWLQRAIPRQPVGLTSLVVCEILQGVRSDVQFREFQRDLRSLPIFESGSVELAVASARNYRLLRAKGLTVRRTIDCILATFCIEEGHTLLHNDRDFDAFETHLGLKVLHA